MERKVGVTAAATPTTEQGPEVTFLATPQSKVNLASTAMFVGRWSIHTEDCHENFLAKLEKITEIVILSLIDLH